MARSARVKKSLRSLVKSGFVVTWRDGETGKRWLVLTQLAADLFNRVPDPTGGLKDPLIGVSAGVTHRKRESVRAMLRRQQKQAEEARREASDREAKAKRRAQPLKGGGTRSGSIL